MKPIAYVGIDIQFSRLTDEDRSRGLTFLYLYDLPYTDLRAYAGLIITNLVEEKFLFEHKSLLEQYLQQGGVIFSLTEVSMPWLVGVPNWKRSPIPLKDREIMIKEANHPIFAGIDAYDLNYRKGVRGFFSRGYFDNIPLHADVLVTDQSGATIIYVDRNSTNGTILAGAGTDIYRVFIHEENSSRQLSIQMLSYIREEYDRNQKNGVEMQ
ncbi:hypothetical protein [Lysinibacillus fusiformis]|uniref:hypothetical protein n=1 Tax=Lysinibacillus fusiformis TaxID=28031 RepID=UPI0011A5EB41|nr:hypothetical protein [Lysinibacillus fusiformis]